MKDTHADRTPFGSTFMLIVVILAGALLLQKMRPHLPWLKDSKPATVKINN